MILLWVTLLLLHQGYTMVRVYTAELGEPVTLTCALPDEQRSSSDLHWYKQSTGNTLTLVVKQVKDGNPDYGAGFSASRLKATYEEKVRSLTILQTVQEDEGLYHCSIIDWNKNYWNGTYLSIKGTSEKGSNITVIQHTVSDLNHSGDPVTLQCSVFSDSDKKTCSGDLRVFWFRAKSDTSYPHMIYSKGNHHDECEKKSDSQNRCMFSMNVSSSDTGTYYCAVATCGQIIFGNGTKVELQGFQIVGTTIPLCAVLAINLIVIAILICSISKKKCVHCKAVAELQKHRDDPKHQKRAGWIYSAAIFSTIRDDSTALKQPAKKKKIYAAVKAFGLD